MRDRFLLDYDSLTLRPRHSTLPSRDDANTSVNFLGRTFKLPVVPSNMEDVIDFRIAQWLAKNGYFYIMHRFRGATFPFVEGCIAEDVPYVSISTGVGKESMDELKEIVSRFGKSAVHCITADVAHADHDNVAEMVRFIKDNFGNIPKIIVGNVATAEGYAFLCKLGVDAVKVGLGGGSICTTRYETGFHIPTAQSVMECNVERQQNASCYASIIADGGIQHRGDIAKALVLGADMVMCGKLFAQCVDSPAKIIHGKKVYRGSTSYEAKGNHNHVEGKTIEMEEGLTYAEQMLKIHQALCSSISYAGGKDLSAFRSVDWHEVIK